MLCGPPNFSKWSANWKSLGTTGLERLQRDKDGSDHMNIVRIISVVAQLFGTWNYNKKLRIKILGYFSMCPIKM